MTAQAAAAKVMRCIVSPFNRIYGEMDADLVDDLIEDLGEFTEESLERGWKQVRRTRKSRPTIAHIIEACEAANENKFQAKIAQGPMPWDECDEKITAMVSDYLGQFQATTTWKTACAEGWGGRLLAYVKAVASYQANKICANPHTPIGMTEIFLKPVREITKDELAEFYRAQAEITCTGSINVGIPVTTIARMKSLSEAKPASAQEVVRSPQISKRYTISHKEKISRTIAFMRENGAPEADIAEFQASQQAYANNTNWYEKHE